MQIIHGIQAALMYQSIRGILISQCQSLNQENIDPNNK